MVYGTLFVQLRTWAVRHLEYQVDRCRFKKSVRHDEVLWVFSAESSGNQTPFRLTKQMPNPALSGVFFGGRPLAPVV